MKDLSFYYYHYFCDFGRIWHLGGFGSMENTPTVCANDLLETLDILKNRSKIEKCKRLSPAAEF